MKRHASGYTHYLTLILFGLCVALCLQTGCGKSENSLSQDVSQSDIESYEQMLKESQAKANAEEEE